MRQRIMWVLALAAGAVAVLGTGTAAAQSCPNSKLSTVSASPSYTYTRGCIVSYDGTPIVYNLFEPLHPAPQSLYTILEGPGWGGGGATSPDENLVRNGYAELTWDPRGFGQSGGVAEVDSPASEGRDVSALVEQVLTGRPEIAVDTCSQDGQPHYLNDPRRLGRCLRSRNYGQPVVGMTGVSYGGGIEWSTASFDKRTSRPSAFSRSSFSGWPISHVELAFFTNPVTRDRVPGMPMPTRAVAPISFSSCWTKFERHKTVAA